MPRLSKLLDGGGRGRGPVVFSRTRFWGSLPHLKNYILGYFGVVSISFSYFGPSCKSNVNPMKYQEPGSKPKPEK
jgi:hypothetical protein